MRGKKAVSEVFGNLLILLIIAITISVMLSYGYPVIMSGQEKVKIRNVVSAMVLAKEKMDVVSADVTPTATLKFPPSGGGISVSNYCQLQVYINSTQLKIPEPGELLYVSGNRIIAVELGGVWEKDGNFDWMIYPPSISKAGNDVSIDVPVMSGKGSAGGYGIATIILRYDSSEVHTYRNANLKLVIKTEFPNAWAKYLSEEGFTVSKSGNYVSAEASGNVSLTIHRIDVLI